MKKLLIAALLGSLCCGTAIAENWTYIQKTSTASMYLGEPYRSGHHVKVWKRAEYTSPIKQESKDSNGRYSYKWVKKKLTLQKYDCRGERWKLLKVVKYYTDGTTAEIDIDDGDWQNIVPDTFGESAYKYVCGR